MDRRARAVKQKRSYDASRRQERARENRNKIIDAAERRFLRDGYGPTTIAAIADDAGVHADTVYKAFGGKPGLVRAIRDAGAPGGRPGARRAAIGRPSGARARWPTDHRGLGRPDRRGRTPRRARPPAHTSGRGERPRGHGTARRDGCGPAATHDRQRPTPSRRRPPSSRRHGCARAADVLWTYSAPELYELLVLRRGWAPARFGRFIADAMIDALL